MAGAKADAVSFSPVVEDPGASIPVPSSIAAGIEWQNRPGSRCVWSQRAQLAEQSGCVTSRQRTTWRPIRR
jgi:hypothetical protein